MIAELTEKRQRLHHENVALLQKVKADNRDVMNGDEEQEWQSRDQAIEALTRQIERHKKQIAIESMLAEPEARRTEPNALGSGHNTAVLPPASAGLARLRQGSQDFDDALRGWFSMGKRNPTERQQLAAQRIGINLTDSSLMLNLSTRALRSTRPEGIREWQDRAQTITTTGGGYTIPDDMMQAIEKALLWFGPMRQAARVIRTESGAPLPFPTVNDTNQVGAILDINTQVAAQDVIFGQMVLGAWKYSSKLVLVPIELMQDTGVNLPELLGEILGERIGRIQNTHFTTGAGTTLPWGITIRATSGAAPTGSVAGGFTYAHVVDLEHSVDPAYRAQGAAFMMHDLVIARFKKLLDTAGRPIWQPNDSASMSQGAPSTLLGYPVWPNNDMATATTTTTRAVLFGAFQKYIIREVLSIELIRLNERYADYHQVGFLAVARADGDLLNAGTNPVKFLAYTGVMPELTTRDLEWSAGFLEGEGFFIERYLHVGSSQKEREPLERLQRYFGGRVHYHAGGGTHGIHRWDLYGPSASGLMMTLYGLMTTRRKSQIRAALTAWKGRPYRNTSHKRKRSAGYLKEGT